MYSLKKYPLKIQQKCSNAFFNHFFLSLSKTFRIPSHLVDLRCVMLLIISRFITKHMSVRSDMLCTWRVLSSPCCVIYVNNRRDMRGRVGGNWMVVQMMCLCADVVLTLFVVFSLISLVHPMAPSDVPTTSRSPCFHPLAYSLSLPLYKWCLPVHMKHVRKQQHIPTLCFARVGSVLL